MDVAKSGLTGPVLSESLRNFCNGAFAVFSAAHFLNSYQIR
jgi:hypothetical protein